MKLSIIEGEVIMLNNNIVASSFDSKTRQLFDIEGICYVYYKDENTLYTISFDTYIKLLLKLNYTVETHLKYGEP